MQFSTIGNYLVYARLQMASESLFGKEVTDLPGEIYNQALTKEFLTEGNGRATKFTEDEANALIAAGWTIVEHKSNTSTGFSGTLFRNLQANLSSPSAPPSLSTMPSTTTKSPTRVSRSTAGPSDRSQIWRCGTSRRKVMANHGPRHARRLQPERPSRYRFLTYASGSGRSHFPNCAMAQPQHACLGVTHDRTYCF